MRNDARTSSALAAAVLLAALAQYAWNLSTQRPLLGYDDDGHMHYVATLVDQGRLPHPMEGWSSFHPPLYHAVLALASLGSAPVWNPAVIGAVSAVPILLLGAVAFLVIRRLGHPPIVAAVATALLLFVPCVQMAATTVGNEALGAAFCALALAWLVGLQRDPRDLRLALAAGASAGLALATKSSGIFVAASCVVPFVRHDFDRRCLRAAVLLGGLVLLFAAPVYVRNLALTGTLLPMTRDRPMVAMIEQTLTIRERRMTDYLWIDPAVFASPLVPDARAPRALDPVMTNVWGLAYASAWYDPHALRVSKIDRDTAVLAGRWLLALGVIPTALVLWGLILALRDLCSRRSRARDAPLAVAALAGLLGFVAFTARVPTTAAVKASYLLPVAMPAAVFFARGVAALGPAFRPLALLSSSVAALVAALLFANGILLPIHEDGRASPLPPRLAEVAAELNASSAGRWRRISVSRGPQGRIVWSLEAFAYAPVESRQLAVWCGYIESAMRRSLPGRRWRAVVAQGAVSEPLRCRDRGSRRPAGAT